MQEYKRHRFDLRQLTICHIIVGGLAILTVLTAAVVVGDLLLNGPLVWPW